MTKINLETKARAGFEAIMLRGGRLVKRKGQVISFAPHVGQLSSVYRGEFAFSFALTHRLNTDSPFALTAGISQSGGKNTAIRAGIAGEF